MLKYSPGKNQIISIIYALLVTNNILLNFAINAKTFKTCLNDDKTLMMPCLFKLYLTTFHVSHFV